MPLSTHGFDQEPIGKPTLGSIVLHVAIFGSLVVYAVIQAHIHGNAWGNNRDVQGAIQATMVTSAPAIPLPQDQKPTDNVLATETPSPAPTPPAPKTEETDVQDSIPIPEKQPLKTKLTPKKQVEQKQEVKQPIQHVPLVPAPLHPQQQVKPDRAYMGEQTAAAIPRSMTQQAAPAAQVNVQGGNFGSMYPWYVDLIKRRTAQNWYLQEVDPGTPPSSRVYITFQLSRTGAPSQVQVQKSSGSPTLDSSCLRAVQRVDSYGPLPNGYNGSSLLVQYYCEKPGR